MKEYQPGKSLMLSSTTFLKQELLYKLVYVLVSTEVGTKSNCHLSVAEMNIFLSF